jgi:hypothetical protein
LELLNELTHLGWDGRSARALARRRTEADTLIGWRQRE